MRVRPADRLYARMDELLAVRREAIPSQDEAEAPNNPSRALPSRRKTCPIRVPVPMDNWDYRGAMDPNLVRDAPNGIVS